MQRNTKQKQLIEKALHTLCHPTAQEVYNFIKIEYPSISMGTVYRILSTFCKQNKIQHIKMLDQADCYDYQTHNHYHLYCKKCSKVYDIDIPYHTHLNKDCGDFKIEDHIILFSGLCADCHINKEGK